MKTIGAKVSDSEYDIIKREAEKSGKTISEFVRNILRTYISVILSNK